MSNVKKKIPPKVTHNPKFGNVLSVSISDSSNCFYSRQYCHEVNTKGSESMVPSYDLDLPNVSPKLSGSSKSLSPGISLYNETFWMKIWLVILLI